MPNRVSFCSNTKCTGEHFSENHYRKLFFQKQQYDFNFLNTSSFTMYLHFQRERISSSYFRKRKAIEKMIIHLLIILFYKTRTQE